MLSEDQFQEVKDLVTKSLGEAEAIWEQHKEELAKMAEAARLETAAVPTEIPGHDFIEEGESAVDNFVALVADMRDSTYHLLQHISHRDAKVSTLQRVFYETSALLPATAQVVYYQDGKVTEYLGDGVLALFRVPEKNPERTYYAALEAAETAIQATVEVVSPELAKRYGLPDIQIGVGMALSRAIITLVGTNRYKLPKAIGECVFRASKLSSEGKNEIYVDKFLMDSWPEARDGKLRFHKKTFAGLDGYLVENRSRSGD